MKRAFTLIETVLYIALLGIVGTGIVVFMISLTDARASAHDVEEIAASARTITHALTYAIRDASLVIAPAEGISANGLTTDLVLDAQGANPNITFRVTNGILYRIVGAGSPEVISAPTARIESLTYINAISPTERDAVRVLMTLQAGSATRSYQFSASVRP